MSLHTIRSRALVVAIAFVAWHIDGGIARAQGNPLPPPWHHADVGDVGIPGDATQGPDGDFFVNGAGSDIWGAADSFHFMYQPMDHDGEVSGDNPKGDATNPFSKVGIMLRLTLDPGSPHVILDVKPDGSLEFMTRQTQGGPTTFIASGSAPGILKLVRRGGIVTAMICGFSPPLCHVIGSSPFPSGPAFAGGVVTSHDPALLNHGRFPVGQLFLTQVQMPWNSFDIGETGLAGDTFVDNGTFTVKGAGADIWRTADSYHAVVRNLRGDGEIVARVTSEDASDTFAKAGVAVFSSVADNRTVILDIRPNGVIEFMARQTAGSSGGLMQFLAGSAASLPVWLKIERRGDQFTGSMSEDGRQWQVVGTTTITGLFDEISAALAVTSHDVTALNTSTFDHVLVASGEPASDDVGDVGIAGTTAEDNAVPFFRIISQGGGADIWGTTDAFQFYYQFLKDDGEISVRVDSLDNTDRFAKVGLMIRDSLDPSAAHVLVDVTPSSLVEVLTRTSAGGDTQWVGGLSPTAFPIWLKLTRSGQQFDAFASTDDRSTWTHLAQASPHISSDALIGVATTSHVRGVVTTATFGGLGR